MRRKALVYSIFLIGNRFVDLIRRSFPFSQNSIQLIYAMGRKMKVCVFIDLKGNSQKY